ILGEVEQARPALEPEDLGEAGGYDVTVDEQDRNVLFESHAEGEGQRYECLFLPRHRARNHDEVATGELSHATPKRVVDQRPLDAAILLADLVFLMHRRKHTRSAQHVLVDGDALLERAAVGRRLAASGRARGAYGTVTLGVDRGRITGRALSLQPL